jgi:hypothetical protein
MYNISVIGIVIMNPLLYNEYIVIKFFKEMQLVKINNNNNILKLKI